MYRTYIHTNVGCDATVGDGLSIFGHFHHGRKLHIDQAQADMSHPYPERKPQPSVLSTEAVTSGTSSRGNAINAFLAIPCISSPQTTIATYKYLMV